MHSKKKGNIGQFAAMIELAKLGFSVFSEEGDISQIDIIAEKDGKLLRIQCKAAFPKNDVLCLYLKKSGPGYHKLYREEDVDYFSLYDLSNHKLYFVPSDILKDHKSTLNLRLNKSKNNQKKLVFFAEDFLPERILRDYTVGTQASG